jgi:hypothetical protein
MKMLTAGIPDGVAVNMLRGFMEIVEGPRDNRWQSRYNDIPRAVSTAREKIGEGPRANARNDRDASPPPGAFDPPAYVAPDAKAIPRRQWLLGRHHLRGAISATVGGPGRLKSSTELVEVIGMAWASWAAKV